MAKAIIIGSGFGGLAAAMRLAARGYEVTVLERLDAPGGRAYVHRQDGFTFDAGPTVITAPFMFEDLWRLFDKQLEDDVTLEPVAPFYRIRFNDGEIFDYTGDPEAMRAEIARFNPDDVAGYNRFLDMSKRIFDVGFTQLAHVPFDRWQSMAKIVPQMLRLKSYKTVYGLVSSYIKDERLRQVLSFNPLLVGGDPFKTTSIYSLIAHLERKWGVWFPKGGTGALVNGMVKLIEEAGGSVRCEAPVKQIRVEGGRATGVILESGEVLDADVVVSNADSANTYRLLVPAEARRHWTDRRVEKMKYSMSLFVWYFGTKRLYPDVAHHTIMLGPRYRGLIKDIFDRKVLAEDFSLYLHRPTATDPSLAPEGHDGFYVLSPVPHLDADVDWTEATERYRAAIEAHLEETVMPGLSEAIVTSRVTTPLDFEGRLASYKGAGFGVAPLFTQSAYFRPHNRSEDVDRLYLVGAGTHPGAGVPGVLSSARILDAVVPDVDAL